MACFYCGSHDHRAGGCPARAVQRAGDQLTEDALKRSAASDALLREIGSDVVGSVDRLGYRLDDLTDSVSTLSFTLMAGFSAMHRQLAETHELLRETLPHPVVTEARDLYEIGCRLLGRGLHSDAERILTQARERDPSSFSVHMALAQTCLELGQEAKAADHFDLANRNAANPSQVAYALLLNARLLMSLDQHERAHELLAAALLATPASALVHYARAQCYGAAGDGALCVSALALAVERDPRLLPSALVDPFLTSVRGDVLHYIDGVERRSYDEAAAALASVEREFESLEEQHLTWYVPASTAQAGAEAEQIRDLLRPHRYLMCLESDLRAGKLSGRLDGLRSSAKASEILYAAQVAKEVRVSRSTPKKVESLLDTDPPIIGYAAGCGGCLVLWFVAGSVLDLVGSVLSRSPEYVQLFFWLLLVVLVVFVGFQIAANSRREAAQQETRWAAEAAARLTRAAIERAHAGR